MTKTNENDEQKTKTMISYKKIVVLSALSSTRVIIEDLFKRSWGYKLRINTTICRLAFIKIIAL